MATTTATITLSSADLLSDNLSLSATTTLYKGGTTATGLEQVNYHRAIIPKGTNFYLIPESDALKDNSNYVYIINKNTDATHYVIISINEKVMGRLYAGDFMIIPWCAASDENDIFVKPSVATNIVIEYMVFYE